MLAKERLEKILEIIEKNNFVSVKKLMEITNFSQPTITRDITFLVNKGLVQKVWGGVRSLKSINPLSFEQKNVKNNLEKDLISNYAKELVIAGDTIFLDEGTTIFNLALKIKNKNITIVTNSLTIFNEIKDSEASLFLVGGHFNRTTNNFLSSIAIEVIDKFKFSKSFLAADGIDENGLYGSEINDCEVRQKVISQSEISYVLADSSKINGGKGNIKYSSIEEVKIITDISIIKHENIIEVNK